MSRRLGVPVAVAAVLFLGPLAGIAQAHVEVTSPDPVQGHEAVITFRVPTEKNVPTVKLQVLMPTATPITDVSVQPTAGWSATVTTAAPATTLLDEDGDPVTEIVTEITWTATAGGIKPNQFDQFNVLADPLPKATSLTFKALQTYGDGSIVSWIQEPVAGAPEPDFPAPVLTIAAADAGSAATQPVSSASGSDTTAVVLAGSALGLGLLALIGAGYAVVTSRRRPDAAAVRPVQDRSTVGAG